MAVNVKLGVDLGDFKTGISEAKEQLKTFDAALKYAEASLKATGDAESAMTTKTEALRGKLETQKKMVEQYTEALKKMRSAGVDQTSTSYQKMQRDLLNAQAAMMNTKAQINGLNTSQEAAAKSADDLATNVGKIGKNVSLQTLADGVSKLTGTLERGARAAIRIGRNIARSAMDSTGYADDLQTRSMQYNIDVETLQRMENVAAYIDTDVDAIITAKDRMSRNRESLAELLGISTDGKTVDDVFWEAGEAIMNLGEGFDQNEYAMKIFGRGWREMLPLFTAGREEYESMMASQNVLTTEQVKALVQADDAFQSLQQQVQLLKNQFWADNAENITTLLQWIVDNKEAVVAALTAIGGAFAALKLGEFALNLTKIVNGFRDLGLFGGKEAAANAAAGAAAQGGAAANAGTALISGSGSASTIANAMTSTVGMIAIAGLMGIPIIAAAARGDFTRDPLAGMDSNTRDIWERMNSGGAKNTGKSLREMVTGLFGGEKAEVPVDLKTDGDAAQEIAAQVGTVTVPATLDWRPSYMQGYGQQTPGWGGHANGLPFVPSDGYLAILHRGERVMTANQNRTYTANSNLYIENMNMGGGMDAQALAAAMSAQNRRISAGFGS